MAHLPNIEFSDRGRSWRCTRCGDFTKDHSTADSATNAAAMHNHRRHGGPNPNAGAHGGARDGKAKRRGLFG